MGFADLLLDKRLDSDSRQKVFQIKDSTRNLLRIINDILDMSKLDAGKVELEFTDFHLPSVIAEVVDMFVEKRHDDRATDVAIRTRLADGFPEGINLDQIRLRQRAQVHPVRRDRHFRPHRGRRHGPPDDPDFDQGHRHRHQGGRH
jgi:signal transduction histidine kinase